VKDGTVQKRKMLLPRALATAGVLAAMSTLVVTDAIGATLPTVTTATGNAYGVKAAGAITALSLGIVPVNVPETPTVSTTNSVLTSTKTLASAYVPLACAFFTATCVVNSHGAKVST